LPEIGSLKIDESSQIDEDENSPEVEGDGDHVCSEECDYCQEDEDCKQPNVKTFESGFFNITNTTYL